MSVPTTTGPTALAPTGKVNKGIIPDPGSTEERVLSAVLQQRRHVLLHGLGGSGKSFCVTQMLIPANECRRRPYNIALTAPTGVAASMLGGVTLHSWAGLGLGMSSSNDRSRRPGERPPTVNEVARQLAKRLFGKPEKLQEIRDTDILLIDEISMVGDDLLDLADQVLRVVRGNVYEPFGGLQLVLMGDVMQLPPVSNDTQKTKFFFHSKVWMELCGGTDPNAPSMIDFYVFNQCKRFDNMQWFNLLSRVRMGQTTVDDKDLLRTRMITMAREEELKHLPFVTGRRATVDNENYYRLDQLPGPDYYCRARDYVKEDVSAQLPQLVLDAISKHFTATAPDAVQLRVGARVMLRRNLDFAEFYLNGSTGTIVAIQAEPVNAKDRRTPAGLTVKKVLVQFDPLTKTMQAMVEERRAKQALLAKQQQELIAKMDSKVKATPAVVKALKLNAIVKNRERERTGQQTDGNEADEEEDSDSDSDSETKEEVGEPGETIPSTPTVEPPKPPSDPMEQDLDARRIWITPFPHEVPFNKQALGLRRSHIASFTMSKGFDDDDPDPERYDMVETGDAKEDQRMRQLANSKGATVKVVRDQIPLMLAYSITVHKVQGATFTSGCRMDLGRESIFAPGMAYVLLSRVPSLDGVHLTRFDPNKITTHADAKLFVDSFKG